MPIEIVVELLCLLGAAVHEGELNRADAIGRYVEQLRAERGGPQGQGQGQDEEEEEARKAEEADGSEKGGGREGRSLQRLRLRKGGSGERERPSRPCGSKTPPRTRRVSLSVSPHGWLWGPCGCQRTATPSPSPRPISSTPSSTCLVSSAREGRSRK